MPPTQPRGICMKERGEGRGGWMIEGPDSGNTEEKRERVIRLTYCPWGGYFIAQLEGGKFSMGRASMRRVVWNDMSMGRVVYGASYPRGKLFTGQVVHEASSLRSGSSMERVDHGTNCPWHGAMCHGVSCHGTRCYGASCHVARCHAGNC